MLNAWQARDLSLLGNTMIVNTLIGSLFVYKMNVLPMLPDKMIDIFNDMIIKYIWKLKVARIPLVALNLPKDQGGLKLVSLKAKEQALKINWVKHYHQFYELQILADQALNN